MVATMVERFTPASEYLARRYFYNIFNNVVDLFNDFWLTELHTTQANEDGDLEMDEIDEEQQSQFIIVRGEHPIREFMLNDIVVVLSTDKDPYWVAKISTIEEESERNIKLSYYHYHIVGSNKI